MNYKLHIPHPRCLPVWAAHTALSVVLLCLSALLAGQSVWQVQEDAFIRGGSHMTTPNGAGTTLDIKTAANFPEYTRNAYLKFDLRSWDASQPGRALLKCHAEQSASLFLTASLTGDGWNEASLTWQNAPSARAIADSAKLTGSGGSFEIDITSAFLREGTGDGFLSLIISDRAGTDQLVKLRSREWGTEAPEILWLADTNATVEPPGLLQATVEKGPAVRLDWSDRSDNETGFMVERSTGGTAFAALDTTLFNVSEYTDSEAGAGHVYRYRITAINPFGDSGPSDTLEVDLSATELPERVSAMSATVLSSGKIRLDWEYSDEGVMGFVVFRQQGESFTPVDTVESTIRTFTDTGREPLSEYSYVLQAVNFLGVSEPSDTLRVTTPRPRNYYFHATEGNDSLPDCSPETPWKSLARINELIFDPGDSVLLFSGSTWQGQLALQGSGTANHPVYLGRYGQGGRPVINGNGAEGAVITLEGLSYWKISGLEITNPSGTQASRLGVLITAGGGSHGHIQLDSLHIHDIYGRYTFQMIGKNTGGIGIIGEGNARFNDVLIENCVIEDIVRVGIFTNGNKGTRGDRPITNLVIRNNTISRCAGDGMIIRYAYRPLIEHNLAVDNHNAPEELVEYGVAIWVRSTDEAVIQHNRVIGTRGSMDGQAFDADLDAYRTVVQYNYSRDNEGGFMLVYGSSEDAIVRYNISQNDGELGKHLLDFPRWVNPRGSGIFHNNVFYIGEGIEAVLVDEALPTARLYNNIVINKGGAPLAVRSNGLTAEFSNNCLVGYDAADQSLNQQGIEGEPGLADPGSGGTEFTSLEGYWLLPESPCLHSALPVSRMEGDYWLSGEMTDFWSNPVDTAYADVGAHQLSDEAMGMLPPSSGKKEILWEVVPVPFTDAFEFRIRTPKPLDLNLNMLDIGGKYIETLYSGDIGSGLSRLSVDLAGPGLRAAEPGVYLLQLISGEGFLNESRMVIRN